MIADHPRQQRTSPGGDLRFARLRSKAESDSKRQVSLNWKVNPLRPRSSSLCHIPEASHSRQHDSLRPERKKSETIHRLKYGFPGKSMAGVHWPARPENSRHSRLVNPRRGQPPLPVPIALLFLEPTPRPTGVSTVKIRSISWTVRH